MNALKTPPPVGGSYVRLFMLLLMNFNGAEFVRLWLYMSLLGF